MAKSFKLFKVCIAGMDENGDEIPNWRSMTVVASDPVNAIQRARLRKKEFAEAVELISYIDRP